MTVVRFAWVAHTLASMNISTTNCSAVCWRTAKALASMRSLWRSSKFATTSCTTRAKGPRANKRCVVLWRCWISLSALDLYLPTVMPCLRPRFAMGPGRGNF